MMLRTHVEYYQFKNGSIGTIAWANIEGCFRFRAWDRSLGAYVWYDA